MALWRSVNQVVVFIMELLMIGSFAYYGYRQHTTAFIRYLLTLLFPVLVIILWALFAAPKSPQRLEMPYLAFFRGVLFLLTAFLWYHWGHKNGALLIAFVSVVTQVTSWQLERGG